MSTAPTPASPTSALERVTLENFIRAETDYYLRQHVEQLHAFGRLHHRRALSIEHQDVIRMNLDTLYSSGVFDLTTPLTITLPESNGRWQSMQIVNQDHYAVMVVHAPGTFTLTQADCGTRYIAVIIRTLINATDPADTARVNAVQDNITWQQNSVGAFEIPNWDQASRQAIHDGLIGLSKFVGSTDQGFGSKAEVNPVIHLVGTASGWGGNPPHEAKYIGVYPTPNDAVTPYVLTIGDVPVDGFWSITVYNRAGFVEPNEQGIYVINDRTGQRDTAGNVTIHFGGDPTAPNFMPIMDGWNYTVRLYQPRAKILDGTWQFPAAQVTM